jgi:hypothetical protein
VASRCRFYTVAASRGLRTSPQPALTTLPLSTTRRSCGAPSSPAAPTRRAATRRALNRAAALPAVKVPALTTAPTAAARPPRPHGRWLARPRFTPWTPRRSRRPSATRLVAALLAPPPSRRCPARPTRGEAPTLSSRRQRACRGATGGPAPCPEDGAPSASLGTGRACAPQSAASAEPGGAAASTTLGSAMGIPPHLPPALRRTSRRLARSRTLPTPCGARRSWRRRRAPRWRRAARATCAAAPSGSYAHRLRAAVDWRRTSHPTVPAALRPTPFPGAVPAGVGELFGRVGALLLFGETRLGLEPRQPAQPRACACLRLQLKTSSSTRAAQ